MATVTELVTEFSFTGSEAPLNRYNRSLNQSVALLASMAAALAASGAAIGKWASGVLQGERSMYNLSFETGIAIEKLQQLNFVAEMSGSTSQAMQSSMESLSAAIGDAAQKGSEDFSRLGIAVRDANGHVRSADAVFRDVQTRFKQLNLSMAEQRSFASALGIDTSLLRMMNQTSGEISKLMARAKELGTLNKDQARQAEQYNQAIVVQRFAMDGLRRLMAVGLAPELTRLVDKFTGLIESNRDWIINGVGATLEVLNDLIDMLGRVWPLLAVGVGVFVAMKIAALGFTGVMAILLSPVVLFTAGIAAAVLVFDDLVVAFNGGESAIRSFFLAFGYDITPDLHEIVRGFMKMVDGIKIIFKGLWEFIKGIFSGMGKLMAGDIKGSFGDVIQAFDDLWNAVVDSFFTIFGEALAWMGEKITNLLPDWAVKFIGGGGGEDRPTTMSGRGAEFAPGSNRMVSSHSTSSINQDVEINVRTSDPERAARLTADSLQRQMTDAQTQSNRGGL